MKYMSYDLYEIGDRIVINVNPESRSCGFMAPPDGSIGTITKFSEMDYSRTCGYRRKAGIYENRAHSTVKMDDGETLNIGSHHYQLADDKEANRRTEKFRAMVTTNRAACIATDFSGGKFIRDLPETRLWEDDVVRVHDNRSRGTYDTEYGKPLVVCRIDYSSMNSTRNDGSPYPFYHISNDIRGGWSMAFEDGELELISRGKVWKHFHGEPISFDNLLEESSFFKTLSMYSEIINPTTRDYSWSVEQAITAIKAGTADAFSVTTSLLGISFKNPIHHVGRFDDRNLGRRVAAEVLKNFSGVDVAKMESDLRDRMQAARDGT